MSRRFEIWKWPSPKPSSIYLLRLDFVNSTHKTNRPKVFEIKSTWNFRNKRNERSIEALFKNNFIMKNPKHLHKVPLQNIPALFEEAKEKPSGLSALSPTIANTTFLTSSSSSKSLSN